MIDCLVAVPFEPPTAGLIDPKARMTMGGHLFMPLVEAIADLEQYVGRKLDMKSSWDVPNIEGDPLQLFDSQNHRSLTAVALASILERGGISWQALDPGMRDLDYWRRALRRLRKSEPRVIALSTTFLLSTPWMKALIAQFRRVFPKAKILVGGPFYATDAQAFFSLDADVFCIGEAEQRLPQIIRRLVDGRTLAHIPGVYYRNEDAVLEFTGQPQQLDMREVEPPDWTLAARILPRVDLTGRVFAGVETQRGCTFKCEFCTYRTLAAPNLLPPEQAAERILQVASSIGSGCVSLTDATASFPAGRWEEVLRHLIARGGSPHPIWAFARASDIKTSSAQLMADAGVRVLFIGQESGDQRMLNLMRKGTRIRDIKPAVRALGASGVSALFGLIHGFPGETSESIQNSRELLATINDGFETKPVVLLYSLSPFFLLDFAAVAQDRDLREGHQHHYLGYSIENFTGEQIALECLNTVIETSKVPHAPVWAFLFIKAATITGTELACHPNRAALHQWLKSIERGVAIFLERDLHGVEPDASELQSVKQRILAGLGPRPVWRRGVDALSTAGSRRLVRRLGQEWRAEASRGAGPVTRLITALASIRDVGTTSHAWRAFAAGTYPDPEAVLPRPQKAEELGTSLVDAAVERSRYVKLRVPKPANPSKPLQPQPSAVSTAGCE